MPKRKTELINVSFKGIYIYIHMYVFMYIYIYIHTHTHTHIYSYTYIYTQGNKALPKYVAIMTFLEKNSGF